MPGEEQSQSPVLSKAEQDKQLSSEGGKEKGFLKRTWEKMPWAKKTEAIRKENDENPRKALEDVAQLPEALTVEPPKKESVDSKTMPRFRNACAAGLVLFAAGCNGEQQGINAAADYHQPINEAPTLSVQPMESLLEKAENGIDNFSQIIPEFRGLSTISPREYSFNFHKDPADGKWHLSGFTKGNDRFQTLADPEDIKRHAENTEETESISLHNHPYKVWRKAESLRHPGFLERNGIANKESFQKVLQALSIISPDKEFPGTEIIEKQIQLIRDGKIPSPPLPPSINDLIFEQAVRANLPPDAKPPIPAVTEGQGMWKYPCGPADPDQLTIPIAEGFKVRDMKKFPLTQQEHAYSNIQDQMIRPYSDEAMTAYLQNNDITKINYEYKTRVDMTGSLVTAAEKIGCNVAFTSYDSLSKTAPDQGK